MGIVRTASGTREADPNQYVFGPGRCYNVVVRALPANVVFGSETNTVAVFVAVGVFAEC